MERRLFLAGCTGLAVGAAALAAGCTTTPPGASSSPEARRRDIDSGADETLARLYSSARGTRELGQRARGILVFPRILAAGLVVGGEYGNGVLRGANGRDLGYYRMVSGSIGWQIGAQSKAVIIMFMTQEALDRFQASKGWSAGVDASVAVATIGASGEIDTMTGRQPVVGFALTNAGLMANATLEGTKITRLDDM